MNNLEFVRFNQQNVLFFLFSKFISLCENAL